MEYIGHFLIIVGLVVIFLTLIGFEKHKDFSKRILISSLTETTAFTLIITGIIMLDPFKLSNLKLVLVLIVNLVLSPVIANILINNYGGRR